MENNPDNIDKSITQVKPVGEDVIAELEKNDINIDKLASKEDMKDLSVDDDFLDVEESSNKNLFDKITDFVDDYISKPILSAGELISEIGNYVDLGPGGDLIDAVNTVKPFAENIVNSPKTQQIYDSVAGEKTESKE